MDRALQTIGTIKNKERAIITMEHGRVARIEVIDKEGNARDVERVDLDELGEYEVLPRGQRR
jgi:hypothetical protein